MKKATKSDSGDEMLPEYDFSKGVRGKYAKRYAEGTNVVLLARRARVFKDSDAVNAVLRGLIELAGKTAKGRKRSRRLKQRCFVFWFFVAGECLPTIFFV